MIRTDVLVVGAGAAGAALGFMLKRAGKETLLLEMQDARKKSKLCAGALEGRAEKAFFAVFGATVDEAGLAPARLEAVRARFGGYELSKVLSRRAPGGQVTPPPEPRSIVASIRSLFRSGGRKVARLALRHAMGLHPEEGYTVRCLPRKRLDDYILGRYLSAGGELLDHSTVRAIDEERCVARCVNLVTKETFDVQYQKLVGADGAASIVRSLLDGRRQRSTLALEARVPLSGEEAVIRLTKGANGYCWYIPRGEDATVGCYYHDLTDNADVICRERLSAFSSEVGTSLSSNLRGALIPTNGDVLLRAGKNAFLVGDAAGLIDVLTGGGIHYALISAKALADDLVGGEPYETAMRSQVDFVKKNAAHGEFFFSVARSFVQKIGKPIVR